VGQFGDKFRKEREKQGISLDDVSNVTKIGSRMLQAIEQEHFDQLPGGVFNKGFIRAYAKHLGLDDEEAIIDYLACMRQAEIAAQEAWQPRAETRVPASAKKIRGAGAKAPSNAQSTQVEELPELQLPRDEHVRPPRKNYLHQSGVEIPWRIIAAAAVIIVLALILWHRHSRNTPVESASTAPATTAPSPQSSTQTSPSNPAPINQTATAHQTANPATTRPATPNPQPGAALQPAITYPASNPATQFTLVILATENSWISSVVDGQPPTQETLIAPAHTTIHATREIALKVGNAAGVSFLWNGKEITSQGAEAEVRTFVFDTQGMRTAPPIQPVQTQ
jgi:cytoskeleton protein RodZ